MTCLLGLFAIFLLGEINYQKETDIDVLMRFDYSVLKLISGQTPQFVAFLCTQTMLYKLQCASQSSLLFTPSQTDGRLVGL